MERLSAFRALALTAVIALSGCEMLATKAGQALLGSATKDGIEAEAELTVGQKNEDNDVNTDTQIGDNQTAEIIRNENSGPNGFYLLLLVLLAGWAIPGPGEMFRGIKNFFRAPRSEPDKP